MSEINLEFIDKTEEYKDAKYIRKFMEDWTSLIHDSSAYYDKICKIRDSSVNYLEPSDDVVILDSIVNSLEPSDDVVILDSIDSSQISFTFKCDMFEDDQGRYH